MAPKKIHVGMRLPAEILDYFGRGAGYIVRIQNYITQGVMSAMRYESLSLAAHNEDIPALCAMVAGGKDVNETDQSGTTALAWAVRYNRIDQVFVLLGLGADPNSLSARGNGMNVLHEAAAEGRLPMVLALLAAGAEIDPRLPRNERTPLMLAASRGHIQVVRILLVAGADPHALAMDGLNAAGIARHSAMLHPRRTFYPFDEIADLIDRHRTGAEFRDGPDSH